VPSRGAAGPFPLTGTGTPVPTPESEDLPVRQLTAWTLTALSLALAVGLFATRTPALATETKLRWDGDPNPAAVPAVVLSGKLSEDDILETTTALAASRFPGVVLFDSPASQGPTRDFLKHYSTERLIAIGPFSSDKTELQKRYGPPVDASFGGTWAFLQVCVPLGGRVVIACANERRLALQAACLAGSAELPLLLLRDTPGEIAAIRQTLADWKTEEVVAVGAVAKRLGKLGDIKIRKLLDETAVREAHLKQIAKKGAVRTLVVANPDDLHGNLGKMSTLAPWIALQKRAALVLTNDAGTDAEDAIKAALKHESLARADVLILAANLKAIPPCKRPNPVEGRDTEIEMEPMTPNGDTPCSFATGRLFHEDRAIVPLMFARQRLLAKVKTPKALIVSNPGGGLPLLETFSRNTTNEFKNAGWDTTAQFGREANKQDVKRALPDATVFLWEGHHSTLVSSYGIPQWPEPLQPSLVFLQSCLALTESKAHPFLQRGAVGVIGSSTRTYSGSGGAFSLAFFDTLLYEEQSMGGSLRQAKNFMLAFVELKKRRFGNASKLGGANVRTAWAFTLWGDPTVKMPRPALPENALPPVRHVVKGNTIIVKLPEEAHDKITSAKYQAVVPANARLAGLVRKQEMSDQHQLVPFVFAEVELPKAKPGTPTVRTKLPDTHWVFCYDQRCQRGYLLVTPRASDQGELRFQLTWE
jgi:hypothetical protein